MGAKGRMGRIVGGSPRSAFEPRTAMMTGIGNRPSTMTSHGKKKKLKSKIRKLQTTIEELKERIDKLEAAEAEGGEPDGNTKL